VAPIGTVIVDLVIDSYAGQKGALATNAKQRQNEIGFFAGTPLWDQ
jgi:ribulose kinase